MFFSTRRPRETRSWTRWFQPNSFLAGAAQVDAGKLNDLKKRKLIQEVQVKIYVLRKGSAFKLELEKQETDLTAEMIASGDWEKKSFKEYNFNAMGIQPDRGHLHPLLKVRAEFRQIFLEMGFSEMPTNRFVESSFWNFDALFQPQQHPARDAHDTFFISGSWSYVFPDLPIPAWNL